MTRLAIIDSGGANIASLQFAVERLGLPSDLTTDPAVLEDASHIILPGVGAAADCMARLQNAGIVDTIRRLRQPVLGICVGMQLLFESSEEGDVSCLGLLPGRVRRFETRPDLPVPHMGWNQLEFDKPSPLLQDIAQGDYVYFVHSFYPQPTDASIVATRTDYGRNFASSIWKDNVYATQFHPEKSQKVGLQLLKNFVALAK